MNSSKKFIPSTWKEHVLPEHTTATLKPKGQDSYSRNKEETALAKVTDGNYCPNYIRESRHSASS